MRIRIDEVTVNDRLRPLDMAKVAELADSIASLGLLNPITVTPDKVLLAGRHRLEAMRLLGRRTIRGWWTWLACGGSSPRSTRT